MARTTGWEHLLQLKEKDLLTPTSEPQGRGRPSHRYEMTRRAKVLSPSRDGELIGELVQFLTEEEAEDLVETFFERYWADRTEIVKRNLRSASPGELEQQLHILRGILE